MDGSGPVKGSRTTLVAVGAGYALAVGLVFLLFFLLPYLALAAV